ncbi:WhiB family transcriptional regulator [Actinopolyspora sp. H202]|uniref:WhiB family transcriptional regulator n=1 Tax=Actinopolyspora sp. H202 TaxID=1500456 RepID=UPI003EE57F93
MPNNRITHFQREQLERAAQFAESDGWELHLKVSDDERRNCAEVPVDVFFPNADEDSGERLIRAERERIAEQCRGCPVADECLAGALLRGERYGGWGGVGQPDFQRLSRIFRKLRQRGRLAEIGGKAA